MNFHSVLAGKRRLAGALATAAIFSAAVACSSSSAAGPASNASSDSASGKAMITLAVLDDPTRRAAFWALQNDKINTGSLAVKITYLSTQSAQVAYQSQQYNVVETSPVAVAVAAQRGLALKVVSAGIVDRGATVLYVRSSSNVRNAGDLRGKRIAVSSTQGSSTVLLQYVLRKKYGLNSPLTGGDVTYVVSPPDTTPELLAQGRVDAAVELNEPAYQLSQTGGFRVADDLTNDARGLVGAYPLQTVLVTYPSVATSELTELLTAMRASVDYATQHEQQVAAAISAGTQNSAGYLAYWWHTGALRYGYLTSADVSGVEAAWTMAVATGQLPSAPAFADVRSAAAPGS